MVLSPKLFSSAFGRRARADASSYLHLRRRDSRRMADLPRLHRFGGAGDRDSRSYARDRCCRGPGTDRGPSMGGLSTFHFRLRHEVGSLAIASGLVLDTVDGDVVRPDRIIGDIRRQRWRLRPGLRA